MVELAALLFIYIVIRPAIIGILEFCWWVLVGMVKGVMFYRKSV